MTAEVGTLHGLLEARQRSTPDRVAFTIVGPDELTVTYRELWAASMDVGAALVRAGVHPGDRVVLGLDTGIPFIAGLFGAMAVGAIAVPGYPPGSTGRGDRLRLIVEDCQPAKVLVATSEEARLLRGVACLPVEEIEPGIGTDQALESVADQTAVLQYTSGSTRRPRGVVLSHRCVLANQALIAEVCEHDETSNFVGWAPLFHDMGLIANLLQPLYLGSMGVLMTPRQFLRRPLRWLQLIDRFDATTSGGPNFAFDYVVDHVRPEQLGDLDLSRWRVAFNSAEPVRAATMHRFEQLLADHGFRPEAWFPCYGLAEHTLLVSRRSPTRPHRTALRPRPEEPVRGNDVPAARPEIVSCGPPAGSVEAVVVDENHRPVPDGMIGELWLAGPSVAEGYWNATTETGRVFGGTLEGSDGRFLRTGDQAFLVDGEMYLCGRAADLLISRGENHNAEELEWAAQQALGGRTGAIAAFAEDGDLDREEIVLVAGLTRAGDRDSARLARSIRGAVVERTGVGVDRVVFVRAGGVPRTPSGKVRRRACRDALRCGDLRPIDAYRFPAVPDLLLAPLLPTGDAAARRRQVHNAIVQAVADRAGVDPMDIDTGSSLAALGLDSVAVVELQAQLEVAFDIALAPGQLLGAGGLATAIDLAAQSDGPLAVPDRPPDTGWTPLSPAQTEIYLDQMANPASTAYTFVRVLPLRGSITETVLAASTRQLGRHHPGLRSIVGVTPSGPVRRVHPDPLPVRPITFETETDAEVWLAGLADRPMPIGAHPMVELHHARIVDGQSWLVVRAHHIIVDLWGASLLLAELAGEAGRSSGPTISPESSSGTGLEEDRQWWADWSAVVRDRSVAGVASTPGHRPATSQQWILRGVGPLASAAAADLGVTMAEYLTSLFGLALCDLTGSEWHRMLLAVSGRSAATIGAVTSEVRTVPLALGVAPGDDRAAYVRRNVETVREAIRRSRFDPRELSGQLGGNGRDLSQVLLAVQQAPPGISTAAFCAALGLGADFADATDGLVTGARPARPRAASHELVVQLVLLDGDMHILSSVADRCVLPVAALMRAFEESMHRDPFDGRVGSASIDEPRPTPARTPPAEPLVDRVIDQAVAGPDRIAVGFDEAGLPHHLSYRALAGWLGEVGRELEDDGVGLGDRVVVELPRSPESVSACLAALAVGAAFVPLDPTNPRERNARIVDQTAPRAHVVADRPGGRYVGRRPQATDRRLSISRRPAPPSLPAHVLFTSGSTGRPKGVVSTLGGLVNRIEWMQATFQAGPGTRVAHKTPTTFDVSLWEFLWPLVEGATVIVVDPAGQRDPDLLVEALRRWDIDICHFVPSMLTALETVERPGGTGGLLPALRHLVFSGESLKPALATLGRRVAPRADLWNLYGPTEASIDVAGTAVGEDPVSIPIGRAIDNVDLAISTPRLTPVPGGGIGELTIGGIALATGYLEAAPTAAAFRPDPTGGGRRRYQTGDRASRRDDGVIDIHGRLDRQVKVRGQRIELAEIERAAEELAEVTAAVAHAASSERGETVLTLHVVGDPTRVDEIGIRRHLRRRLPPAFIPHRIAVATHLPVGRHGKLSPSPSDGSQSPSDEVEIPEGSGEATVAAVMAQVLERPSVGRHQSFYDLGGDSLLALRVVAELRQLGREVHVVDLMRWPTPAGLAEAGRDVDPSTIPVPGPFELLEGARPPGDRLDDAHPASSTDAALLFLSRADRRHETYVTSLRLRGRVQPLAWEVAYRSLLTRHPYLRSRFELVDGRWIQCVRPTCESWPVFGSWRKAQDPRATWERFVDEERRRPIDVDEGPVVRLAVHVADRDDFVVTLSSFSLDGWCVAIVLTELLSHVASLMQGRDDEPVPPVLGYPTFVELERDAISSTETAEFWARLTERARSTRLAALSTPAPEDQRDPLQQRYERRLGADQLRGAEATASALGVPLKTVLLTVHLATVAQLSGQARVTTGLEVNGRVEAVDGDRTIGVFNNIVPLPVSVGGRSWSDLAVDAAGLERDLWPHRRLPLDRIEALGPRRQRLFDTLFVFTAFHLYEQLERQTSFELIEVLAPDQTHVPFTVHLNLSGRHGGLRLIVDHEPGDGNPELAEHLARAFETQLDRLIADPDGPAVPPSVSERTGRAPPATDDLAIGIAVRNLAAAAPDRIAVEAHSGRLSYRRLIRLVDDFQAAFRATGAAGGDEAVALVIDPGDERLAGLLIGALELGLVPLVLADAPGRHLGELVAALRPTMVIGPFAPQVAQIAEAAFGSAGDTTVGGGLVIRREPDDAGRSGDRTAGPSSALGLAFEVEGGADAGAIGAISRAGLADQINWMGSLLGGRTAAIQRADPGSLALALAGLTGGGTRIVRTGSADTTAVDLAAAGSAVAMLPTSLLADLAETSHWPHLRRAVRFLVIDEPLYGPDLAGLRLDGVDVVHGVSGPAGTGFLALAGEPRFADRGWAIGATAGPGPFWVSGDFGAVDGQRRGRLAMAARPHIRDFIGEPRRTADRLRPVPGEGSAGRRATRLPLVVAQHRGLISIEQPWTAGAGRGRPEDLHRLVALLLDHPSVRRAAVLDPSVVGGRAVLAAMVESPGIDGVELRRHLVERAGGWAGSIRLLAIDTWPTDVRGRTDHLALALSGLGDQGRRMALDVAAGSHRRSTGRPAAEGKR